MTLRLIGALLIFVGCGGVGISLAVGYRKQMQQLSQLQEILSYMENELSFRSPQLPQLCREASRMVSGSMAKLFNMLADELDAQIFPNAGACMRKSISMHTDLSKSAKILLGRLGQCLGRFDLQGQLNAISAVKEECGLLLNNLRSQQDVRIRNYQTLGLCAGAALAILLI